MSRFDGLLEPASKEGMASLSEAALISMAISMKRIADHFIDTYAAPLKSSPAYQADMAAAREILSNVVVQAASSCGIDCDCTAECERDFFNTTRKGPSQ